SLVQSPFPGRVSHTRHRRRRRRCRQFIAHAGLDLGAMVAQQSDAAFRQLVEAHQRAVRLHCYRMLGSLQDAEDLTQETLLRAWRAYASFEGRASVRAWLHRIATNACLDELERRGRRLLPVMLGAPRMAFAPAEAAPAEVPWLDPVPDAWLDVADTA